MREKYNNILNSRLAQNKSYIEKELKKILSDIDAPKPLKEVMLYAVLNGGKRIRPFIISEVSSLYQVGPSIYKYPSMAIEMAHCFSLIYDDLPCMDDDKMRRGKPSTHLKFGEASAVLAGNSLLTLAFEIIASQKYSITPKMKNEIIKSLAFCSGHTGIAGGQELDLKFENKKKKISQINEMQKKKNREII